MRTGRWHSILHASERTNRQRATKSLNDISGVQHHKCLPRLAWLCACALAVDDFDDGNNKEQHSTLWHRSQPTASQHPKWCDDRCCCFHLCNIRERTYSLHVKNWLCLWINNVSTQYYCAAMHTQSLAYVCIVHHHSNFPPMCYCACVCWFAGSRR